MDDNHATNEDHSLVGIEKSVLLQPESMEDLSPIVRLAMNSEIDPEKLDRMITIQEKYERRNAEKEFYKAFSKFKQEAPVIVKDKKVEYEGNNGGVVGYTHVSLAHVMNTLSDSLGNNGLAVSWIPVQSEKGITVTAVLSHMLGHSVAATMSSPPDTSGKKNSIQSIGSAMKYLQRYTILALLGLDAQDQDDDGAASEQTESTNYQSEQEAAQFLMTINTIDELKTACERYKGDHRDGKTGWTSPEWKRITGHMNESKSRILAETGEPVVPEKAGW